MKTIDITGLVDNLHNILFINKKKTNYKIGCFSLPISIITEQLNNLNYLDSSYVVENLDLSNIPTYDLIFIDSLSDIDNIRELFYNMKFGTLLYSIDKIELPNSYSNRKDIKFETFYNNGKLVEFIIKF